jgi:hypothetical protein
LSKVAHAGFSKGGIAFTFITGEIVGSLLYYARAVNNKLLAALSAIATHQAYATVATEQAVHLLLDYVATYPADGIV